MSAREATLLASHFCAPHTKHFRFRAEGGERFEFQPGQFVSLTHVVEDTEMTRYYSIASPPRADNQFDLCLNRSETSPSRFATFLFELEAGARLRLGGPFGEFRLRPEARDSLFIATGTGIAPFRAMVPHFLASRPACRAWLLYGVRSEKNILFAAEFSALAAAEPRFRFLPTLSRPPEGWHGATGYVQEHLERLLAGRSDLDVYLCGLTAMVNEVRGQLESAGLPPEAIVSEKYD